MFQKCINVCFQETKWNKRQDSRTPEVWAHMYHSLFCNTADWIPDRKFQEKKSDSQFRHILNLTLESRIWTIYILKAILVNDHLHIVQQSFNAITLCNVNFMQYGVCCSNRTYMICLKHYIGPHTHSKIFRLKSALTCLSESPKQNVCVLAVAVILVWL